MTIRQQGGVFGRNPVFNEAEAKDLTVTNSMNVDNGTLQVDPVNNRVGVKIAPTADLHVYNAAGAMVRVEATSAPAYLNLRNSTRSWNIYTDNVTGKLSFFDVTFGVERMALSTDGNLSFLNGRGIDFSATSGTGTSELFDDYEEGTWTPSLAFGTSVVLNSAAGTYTKMGRLVYVTFNIDVASHTQPDTSPVSINGLPYNIAADIGTLFSIDPVASTFIDLTTTPLGGVKTAANTYLQLYQTDRSAISYTEAAASGKLVGAAMYEAS